MAQAVLYESQSQSRFWIKAEKSHYSKMFHLLLFWIIYVFAWCHFVLKSGGVLRAEIKGKDFLYLKDNCTILQQSSSFEIGPVVTAGD